MRIIDGVAGVKKATDALAETLSVKVIDGASGRVLLAVGTQTASLELDEAEYIADRLIVCVNRLKGEPAK